MDNNQNLSGHTGQRVHPKKQIITENLLMKKNEILRSYGTDYKEMTKRLLEEADLISDIPASAVTIGIKPNLVTPTPASYGATTHPEIIAGIIEYLNACREFEIILAEGSWVGDKTSEAFEYCGYNRLAQEYGVKLLDTQKDGSHKAACANHPDLRINNCIDSFDYLINVPVLKGHCQTKITCALKNIKGLIPNAEKRRFHTMGLHKPIAYLNACIKQDFIVADHICGDLDFEEGGNPVTRNCIMAAKDPVLLDTFVCALLGYSVSEVSYVKLAGEIGIGSCDLSTLQLRTVEGTPPAEDTPADLVSVSLKNRQGGKEGSDEQPTAKNSGYAGGKRLLSVSYAVNEIDSCSACYGTLIPALTRLKEEGLLDQLTDQIAIGQGHRGKTGPLGVGNCTSEFDFCIKGCPPTEKEMYIGLKEYLLQQKK